MDILYSDDRVVVCIKPAGVLSTDEPGGMPELLRAELGDDGQPILSIHRLDRPGGGVMVYARTHRAAAELGEQMRRGRFHKEYFAVVHGTPEKERVVLRDFLHRNTEEHKSYIVPDKQPGSLDAVLETQLVETRDELSLLRVRLMTGRTHQIRCQLAGHGLPIVGDRKYGLPEDGESPALWSCHLLFFHPRTGEKHSYYIKPPETEPWNRFTFPGE